MSAPRPQEESLVRLTVNGSERRGVAEPRLLLSDFLREELRLTGVHVGCEQGECGACTVLLDGEPIRSCLMFAVQAQGADVRTVEGIPAEDGGLDRLQRAFQEHHGLQCGFCTPGLLLTAGALLAENPEPSRAEIAEHLAGNVCRCTGYSGILDAVAAACDRRAEEGAG
jgi:aerobic carbon-monoxide dehydrogenase small subunit